MTKRNLRVTKWVGTIPAVGQCTACKDEFRVAAMELKRLTEAQESLRRQFAEHECRIKEGSV